MLKIEGTIHAPQGTTRENHAHMVLRLEYNAIANAMNEKSEELSSTSKYLDENKKNDVVGNNIHIICEYKRALGRKIIDEWESLQVLLTRVRTNIRLEGLIVMEGYLIKNVTSEMKE